MKTIVFIDTHKSGSSREAIKAAEGMGYFTVLLTDKQNHIEQRTEYPDVHQMILCDLNDYEMLKRIIEQLQLRAFEIKAIVSFIEPYCYKAFKLAEDFGINKFTLEAIEKMQNKVLSREVLRDSVYAPKYITLKSNDSFSKDEIMNILPVVIKSPQSTGGKDVYLVKSYDDFIKKMLKQFKKYPFSSLLVEEYLDGPQYLVETLVINEEVKIIAIILQEINYFNEHFIVTGYNLILNPEESFYNKIKKAVTDIIKRHGMKNGACHLEIRNVKDNLKLIEINPRISGGGMNDFIKIAYGINLMEETLKLALGLNIDINPKFNKHTFSEYLVVNASGKLIKVTGRKKAKKLKGVQKLYIKPRKGSYLFIPVSLGNRYAYVIANGDTEEEARSNAKEAAKRIKFHLEIH